MLVYSPNEMDAGGTWGRLRGLRAALRVLEPLCGFWNRMLAGLRRQQGGRRGGYDASRQGGAAPAYPDGSISGCLVGLFGSHLAAGLAAAEGETSAVDGNRDDAIIVVLPKGMDPAERDAILQKVMDGRRCGAAVPGGRATAFLTARPGSVSSKLRDGLSLAIRNVGRIPEVPGRVFSALERPGDTRPVWLVALIVLATLFAGAAIVEVLFRRLVWRPLGPSGPGGGKQLHLCG